jgi:quercetin dioxygenase-like cupin family protein
MPTKLSENPVHLGLGASAEIQPDYTGDMAWYEAYSARNASDGAEGRLVTIHCFSESWTSWEMHPLGCEVVLCTQGRITLIQELKDGVLNTVILNAGEYAINPPGVWHTADVEGEATALFITAGAGTEHKPR